jgi:hypothetical protein
MVASAETSKVGPSNHVDSLRREGFSNERIRGNMRMRQEKTTKTNAGEIIQTFKPRDANVAAKIDAAS